MDGGSGARLCENAQEPARRRIIFSIALFPTAATALFLFRLAKSRRTFYAQIGRLCFHTTSGIFADPPRGQLPAAERRKGPLAEIADLQLHFI
jgi:hypothetical protein